MSRRNSGGVWYDRGNIAYGSIKDKLIYYDKDTVRKAADTDSIVYDSVPGNAVFQLRDLTKEREEQRFAWMVKMSCPSIESDAFRSG